MSFSDLITKVGRGETLSASEAESLRQEARALDEVMGAVKSWLTPGSSNPRFRSLSADNANISSGEVVIDENGVTFDAGSTALDVANAVKWLLEGVEIFRVIGYTTGTNNQLLLQVNEIADRNGQIAIRAHSPTSGALSSVIRLGVYKDGIEAGAIQIQSISSSPTINLEADLINAYGELRTKEYQAFDEQASTPGNPSAGDEVRMYMKSNKIVFQFNDGGTVRYKFLDLTGTGVTWVHDTAAP